MTDTYVGYLKDVQAGKPGASEALERFTNERVKYHEAKCDEWQRTRKEEKEKLEETQCKRLTELFRGLGHADEDIQVTEFKLCIWEFEIEGEIDEKVWQRVRLNREPDVIARRLKRFETQYPDIVKVRKSLVKNIYHDYAQTLRPSDRLRLPPVDMVYMTPSFRFNIYENPHASPQAVKEQCDEAARQLPEIVSTYHASIKAALLVAINSAAHDRKPDWKELGLDHRLGLATSAFESELVDELTPLCSIDGVLAYFATEELATERGRYWLRLLAINDGAEIELFEWDWVAYKILTVLALALGLDPVKATPRDFDERASLMFCGAGGCSNVMMRMMRNISSSIIGARS
ncbi:hypothetical protein EVJ58_g4647 [Rhodofomes roseus]|uniref:Uncharacterized protein n=1 Tax=Rhodofomes roseus TaxID=34475 RepID=A0A4Y9YID6_9APHY|nr:hypothetical protein EVJ58_g4647 [Rhodofomes roseus]